MKPQWLSIVCCVTTLVVHSHGAAVPTQDTFVVAKSEGEVTEATGMTTEEPGAPIKLTQMRVHSEVSLRYAVTAVVTHVRNPSHRSQEATFHVLLPETAFISEFVMTLNGKPYKAYVKEKSEAKKIYSEAVSQGIGAAHISAKARDSNHFTVSVNVEPNTEAMFNLTYEELLVRRIGVYNHAINLHPGALVPKMEVTVHIKESQKINVLRVPEVRTGNEIDATENDAHYAKVTIQKSNDEKEATVTFTPDLEEQKRLMQVYAAMNSPKLYSLTQQEKVKESASTHRHWYASEDQQISTTGVLGQFVVQYDVDRPANGEVLVNDGYFVHFFAPKDLKPLSKLVVFVLDTSSSMSGRKIEQLRDAMRAILADLHPSDFFSIVEFSSNVKVHKLSEALKEPVRPHYSWQESDGPAALVPPARASSDNIEKAKVIVSRLSANGGTNIYDALDVAVDVINKAYAKNKTVADNTTTTTNEDTVGDDVQPIIIFLTDGDATVGETNPSRILSYITEKNSGDKKAAIYSLAFGQDADRNLLRKLSLRNEGFMRQIYEAADAALQLRNFYLQVSSPLLAHVNFAYPPDQVKPGSVTKHSFTTTFAGSEVVVAGELAPATSELEPQVTAFCADDNHGRKRFEIKNKVAVKEKNGYLPLERLWAYLTIKQLLDEREALDQTDSKDEKSPEKRALAIALKYSFVTPLTSLVVVKPNATNAVDAESADKPPYALPQPAFGYSQGLAGAPYRNSMYISSPSRIFGAVPLSAPFSSSHSLYSEGLLLAQHAPIASSAFFPQALDGVADYQVDALEEEDLDAGSLPFNAYPTTPAPFLLSTTVEPPTSTTENLEESYHLKSFSWALSLLNSERNSLEFSANGKNVTLELSKSDIPPKDAVDSECAQSAGAPSEAGVCVYLTRCAAARDIGLDEYRTTYCVVENKYAGVCCPKNKVDITTTP
ncbi:inter-alpha-trypsin inhibitor heavy chain H4-like [Melitaea cinxia]|uniref:inter-alpha-trypsin inhibitor heavy chain H4-like n=1 Tax=Melitaea cinxia TaxID=113334 RepID=UPI001E26EA53|nr:inter-alpha-trypsin inhibitor heavy chain H4-like [Melitaea cinxia]